MAQSRDLSYRFGGWRADVRATSWMPPHPAFPFTIGYPELGTCFPTKRGRRGGDGQVRKGSSLLREGKGTGICPPPPRPGHKQFPSVGQREAVNSMGKDSKPRGTSSRPPCRGPVGRGPPLYAEKALPLATPRKPSPRRLAREKGSSVFCNTFPNPSRGAARLASPMDPESRLSLDFPQRVSLRPSQGLGNSHAPVLVASRHSCLTGQKQ